MSAPSWKVPSLARPMRGVLRLMTAFFVDSGAAAARPVTVTIASPARTEPSGRSQGVAMLKAHRLLQLAGLAMCGWLLSQPASADSTTMVIHSCAVTSAGGVNNGFGQLGNGSTSEQIAPVDVSGLGEHGIEHAGQCLP